MERMESRAEGDGDDDHEATQQSPPTSMHIYPLKSSVVSPFLREKYEKNAKRNWDVFYKRNANRFFKDRHYLEKEWRQYFLGVVADSPLETKIVLEVGCGAGNTVFPLRADFPHLFIHACDFSPRAINLVKSHRDYSENYIHAFVCDVTSDMLSQEVASSSLDVVTLVFTLSAIAPEKMLDVLKNIKEVLKPGGHVLVRDYAVGDLAQERLDRKDQKISENFYVRGDGTRAFYFSEEFLNNLFSEAGFIMEKIFTHSRCVENRLRKLTMHRRWIQGAFCLSHLHSSPADKKNGDDFLHPFQMEGPPDETLKTVPEERPFMETAMVATTAAPEIDHLESIAGQVFKEPLTFEVTNVRVGCHVINAKLLSRELQHTFKATGFMLWESAPALAYLLYSNPHLLYGRTVLEVGCGSLALCALIASLAARKVVATDGDLGTLELLGENLERNSKRFPVEKIARCHLQWGNMEAINALIRANKECFQLVIGTDVTYVPEAVPLLFETCRAVLGEASSNAVDCLVLLCHVIRNVAEDEIVSMAEKCGFHLYSVWSPQKKEHAFQVNGSSIQLTFSGETMADEYPFSSALEFMCFGLKQQS